MENGLRGRAGDPSVGPVPSSRGQKVELGSKEQIVCPRRVLELTGGRGVPPNDLHDATLTCQMAEQVEMVDRPDGLNSSQI